MSVKTTILQSRCTKEAPSRNFCKPRESTRKTLIRRPPEP